MANAVGTKEVSNKNYNRAQLGMMAGQVREARKTSQGQAGGSAVQPKWMNNQALAASDISTKKQKARSTKEALQQSKKKAKAKVAVEKAEMRATAPIRKGTSWLLRMAWLNAWDTFGLSVLYVNLHIFCRMIFGKKLFTALGGEWTPETVKEMAGTFDSTGSKLLGYVEILALTLVNVVLISILLISFIMLYLLIDIWLHPIASIWNYGIKTMYSIFKTFL